ncbi:formyltetrahydrofolate deformylase [Methyloraptor flagellatus]|jgi:formyltetrahydrofolate deformylase|uniref:Formyltetrahydrofolate deformylase n=1 Tax=Methyloraptor flagellatus TaxID=3162530 RepID=A0AAU7XAA3_9HYPH
MTYPNSLVLTLACPDTVGIVAAVAATIADHGGNITESAQYGDPDSGTHFMRVAFKGPAGLDEDRFRDIFTPVAERFGMAWRVRDVRRKQRVMILVSKMDHCLVDLLYRWKTGQLPMDVTSIVSNHRDHESHAVQAGLPFHYLPVTKETKLERETELFQIFKDEKVELGILARYMQVLSDGLSAKLSGRCINIHHSFLPSFKGANPYSRAHERGVKLIGATAHYVTTDLDEGPIIEQETERVDHAMTIDEFVAIGRGIEARVLARGVKFHLEDRVLINKNRTVVFR